MEEAVSPDDLRLEVAELRASRARVVAAADAERRRIERDLHDGAQQHLVAVVVNLQLARQLAESEPGALGPLLEEIAGDVRDALESVRALAQGIYPPLLRDRGLAEAVRALAAGADVHSNVQIGELERYSLDIEASVYFCCLEALRATASPGGGGRMSVHVRQEEQELVFEILLDAIRAEEAADRYDEGLTRIADRLGAVGGRLTLAPGDGPGLRLAGRVPLTS